MMLIQILFCHDDTSYHLAGGRVSRQGRDWYIAQGGQGLSAEKDIVEEEDHDNDFVYYERGL